MRLFVSTVESISEWTGRIFSWLVLILAAVMFYEVVSRYGFGRPTIFAFDLTFMLYGAFIMLGGAYTLWLGGHVRMDLLYSLLPTRRRAMLEVVGYLVFFFPLVYVLAWYSTDMAISSWMGGEVSGHSVWRPPLYPSRTVMAVGFYLLGLQGVSEFIKHLHIALRDRPL